MADFDTSQAYVAVAEVLAGEAAYDNISVVKSICDNVDIASFVVRNFRVGGFAGYDINYGELRYGYYVGYHIALGTSTKISAVTLKK